MNHETFFRVTYGLYVVSSTNGSRGNGFVANAVFQVTAKPARFAVACNKDNYTCELIGHSKVFALSVLRQDTQAELIGRFG
jgi:flavin reductase (DIM6/NTAB) family NADH-FMN oxidoreductase RutF